MRNLTRFLWAAVALLFANTQYLNAADHGPVFGLATPTNPKGGWSFDLGVNGRGGTASTLEAALSYGLTQNLKLAVSGPVVFHPDPYPRSSVTTNTPISGDFSGLAWWRFQRKDFKGKRVESTAVAGVLVPGTQQEAGIYRGLNSGPGYLVGGVSGVASRSHYVWAGATYQRYAESKGDRRPDLLSFRCLRLPPSCLAHRLSALGLAGLRGIHRRANRCAATRKRRCVRQPGATDVSRSQRAGGVPGRWNRSRNAVSPLSRCGAAVSARAFSLCRQFCLLLLKGNQHEN